MKRVFATLAVVLMIALAACDETNSPGDHPALGTAPNGNGTSTQADTFGGLDGAYCTAIPQTTTVYSGQLFVVNVTVYNVTSGTVNIDGTTQNAVGTTNVAVEGALTNTSGVAVSTPAYVTVTSSNNGTFYCSFTVVVSPYGGTSGTGCSINVSNTSAGLPTTVTVISGATTGVYEGGTLTLTNLSTNQSYGSQSLSEVSVDEGEVIESLTAGTYSATGYLNNSTCTTEFTVN